MNILLGWIRPKIDLNLILYFLLNMCDKEERITWSQHCKTYAKEHNTTYSEAGRSFRCVELWKEYCGVKPTRRQSKQAQAEAMRPHSEELHRRKKMALETLIDEIQPLDLERFINKLTSREHLRSYNTAKYAVEYHPPLPIVYCDHLNHLLIGYKKLKSEHADFQREIDELMIPAWKLLKSEHEALQSEHEALQSEHEALQSEHEALQRENAELKFI